MPIDRVSSLARAVLPPRVFRRARSLATAVLAPLRFSLRSGHARSAFAERAVDARGDALPWYTYPAIEALSAIDVAGRSVLEIGAGQSTVWWVERGARVTAVEDDDAWYAEVSRRIGQRARVLHVRSDLADLPADVRAVRYDVVAIDGLDRHGAALLAIGLVTDDGCILVDNAEGDWGNEPGQFPIARDLRAAGFQRVDFVGFAPGVLRRHCTSIYFRERCFVFASPAPPQVPYP